MTPKTFLYGIASVAAVAALATSCQDDDYGLAAGNSETITFDVLHAWAPDESRSDAPRAAATAQHLGCDTLVSDDKQDTLYLHRSVSDLAESAAMSRAAIATAANLEKFKVSCVKNKDGGATEYYFTDLVVSKQGSGNFSNSENKYYWLGTGEEKYDFYAYAPSTFSATHPATAGAPNFIYNSGAGHNCDLMVAKQTDMPDKPASDAAAVVGLSFEHLLSGIRFKVDAGCDEIKISKIEIKGLNMSGTCSYDGTNWTWSNLLPSSTKSLVRNFETSYNTTPGTESDIDAKDTEGNPTEATFFVVPQTIPAGASIELTFKKGEVEKTLSAPLSGTLGKGKLITYAIKVDELSFTVEQEGLHLKIRFNKSVDGLTFTPSIKLKNDTEGRELIDKTVGFYGTGTTLVYNKLSGPDTQGYYYYDGSFFMSKAIDTYNALQPTDALGDDSKYCWDSTKDITKNEDVKTQTYTVTLSNSTASYSQDVDFHFDYMEFTYKPNSTNKWVHCLLRDTRPEAERGNFTMEDCEKKTWRNSSSAYYSDELLGSGQKMEGLTDVSSRKFRIYISKDAGLIGYENPASLTDNDKTDQKCIQSIDTPVPKIAQGIANFPYAQGMRAFPKLLMAKNGNGGLKDLSYCFYQCYNSGLTSIDLSSFDTSEVTDMKYMFNSCYRLQSLNVSGFDTSKVKNMKAMFQSCTSSSFKSLDLSTFNTKNVENMSYMFASNSWNLETITFSSNFDTSNVTDMRYMFSRDYGLKELDLSTFNTAKVEYMQNMFDNCQSLETIIYGSNFDTSSVRNMSYMFCQCNKQINVDLSFFKTQNVENMLYMFYNCNKLESLDLSNWNAGNVTTMFGMFSGDKSLTTIKLDNWNTSKVENMSSMFSNCEKLESLDLSSFDTSNVTNMSSMFNECSAMTSLNLKIFDATQVTNYSNMFYNLHTPCTINANTTFQTWVSNHSNVKLPTSDITWTNL